MFFVQLHITSKAAASPVPLHEYTLYATIYIRDGSDMTVAATTFNVLKPRWQ